MKNFIEKNSKWIVRIFMILGLFLILKLFWFSGEFVCGSGGGFIDLCLVPKPRYYWINSSTISLIFFIISLLFIIEIKITKNKIKKVILSFLILLMGLLGKQLFYIVSPDFKFYFTDEQLIYMDKDYHPKDVDLYLEYMGKYCNETKDDFVYKNVGRETLCAGKYLYNLKTVENYKKVFDFANKNNMRELYRLTFTGAEKFGLEKIIEEYRDDTFYGYIIFGNALTYNINSNVLTYIDKNTLNIRLKEILNLELDSLNVINKNSYNEFKKIEKDILNKLREIQTINTKIF